MFEVFWTVHCEQQPVNRAARRVGIDWATGRRWVKKVERYLRREDLLDDRWCSDHSNEVHAWREARYLRVLPWTKNDVATASDQRWFDAAHAAEVLFRQRDSGIMAAAEYHDLFAKLTDRRTAGTVHWNELLRKVAPKHWWQT